MKRGLAALLTASIVATSAATAAHRDAQEKIPVRTLTAPLAVSRDTFKLILTVKELPGGKVMVNDGVRKRLVVLDSALRLARIVFDTVAGADNFYGTRPEPILPYAGDSTVFVDANSQSLILIDQAGNVARTIAAPNAGDMFLVASATGGIDAQGRLLFRGLSTKRDRTGLSVNMNGGSAPTSNADSNPIIRGNFQTRAVDTIAALKNMNVSHTVETTDANGFITRTTYLNPRPTGDEWTVTSDGTVAIARGHDYHIDWITTNGEKSSTDKLPFDWLRITDEEKERLRDSTLHTMSRIDSLEVIIKERMAAGGGAAAVGRAGGAGGDISSQSQRPVNKTGVVDAKDIPDYMPPIRQGAVIADRDNNVWILPTTSAQSLAGELVYDVVNRQGVLFERVRLPVGRSIIGFGKGGGVYLMHGTLKNGFQIERTRIAASAR